MLIKNLLYILHVNVTKHNLKVSILKPKIYNLIYWTNLGASGFRKDESNSDAASSSLATIVGKKIKSLGIKYLGIYLKGVTRWKKTYMRQLLYIISRDIRVMFIRDITPIPFNGCSPQVKARKRRRKRRKKNSKRYFKPFFSIKTKKRRNFCVSSWIKPILSNNNDFIKNSKKL